MMWMLIFAPFVVQAVSITLDEYVFHIKRGLPKWERIGHPLDTLSVLSCFLFVFFFPYSETHFKWYIGIAIFSCILITKDEFVHKHHCPASEQWLHALLFVNHPIMLAALAFMWPVLSAETLPSWVPAFFNHKQAFYPFLLMQIGTISFFLLYQVIYWNFIWKPKTLPL